MTETLPNDIQYLIKDQSLLLYCYTATLLYYYLNKQSQSCFLRNSLMDIGMINLTVFHLPQWEDYGKQFLAARIEGGAEDS